jgi:hypothetical protein
MTTTTINTWLVIRLVVSQRVDEIVFSITFKNDADQPQQLMFSNLSRKAELLGLRIKDANGKRIEPDRKFIGRPTSYTEPGRWLKPGQEWSYELIGKLTNGVLDFPSALYRLTPGQHYYARFVYQHIPSNEVEYIV